MTENEYQDITRAVQYYLQTKGTSLKRIPNPGVGPTHEGLTRMLGWKKKGSKHFGYKHRRTDQGIRRTNK